MATCAINEMPAARYRRERAVIPGCMLFSRQESPLAPGVAVAEIREQLKSPAAARRLMRRNRQSSGLLVNIR